MRVPLSKLPFKDRWQVYKFMQLINEISGLDYDSLGPLVPGGGSNALATSEGFSDGTGTGDGATTGFGEISESISCSTNGPISLTTSDTNKGVSNEQDITNNGNNGSNIKYFIEYF